MDIKFGVSIKQPIYVVDLFSIESGMKQPSKLSPIKCWYRSNIGLDFNVYLKN